MPQMMEQRLVSIPKSELDSLVETVETLENKEVMEQLESSEMDIVEGRVRDARQLLEEF